MATEILCWCKGHNVDPNFRPVQSLSTIVEKHPCETTTKETLFRSRIFFSYEASIKSDNWKGCSCMSNSSFGELRSSGRIPICIWGQSQGWDRVAVGTGLHFEGNGQPMGGGVGDVRSVTFSTVNHELLLERSSRNISIFSCLHNSASRNLTSFIIPPYTIVQPSLEHASMSWMILG